MFQTGAAKKINFKLTGFTIIELMVVIGILVVLVVLVAPNILRSRVIANEGVALTNVKSITNACQQFHIDHDAYPASLTELGESNPPYIDPVLATGSKKSYNFIYGTTDSGFSVNANPTGLLKGRYLYADESGVIRAKHDSAAGPNDPAVE